MKSSSPRGPVGVDQAREKNGRLVPEYFDNTGRDDVLSGGVEMIAVTTPKGTFRGVWTDRVGNNPLAKVHLLGTFLVRQLGW